MTQTTWNPYTEINMTAEQVATALRNAMPVSDWRSESELVSALFGPRGHDSAHYAAVSRAAREIGLESRNLGLNTYAYRCRPAAWR